MSSRTEIDGRPCHETNEGFHQPRCGLPRSRRSRIAHQHPGHEGVGLIAPNGVEIHGLAAVQKRAELLRGAKSFDV